MARRKAASGEALYEAHVRREEAFLAELRACYTAPRYCEDARRMMATYIDDRLAELRAGGAFEICGVDLRAAAHDVGLELDIVGHHRYRLHPDGRIEALGCPWGCG
jgi:hypothetical protein